MAKIDVMDRVAIYLLNTKVSVTLILANDGEQEERMEVLGSFVLFFKKMQLLARLLIIVVVSVFLFTFIAKQEKVPIVVQKEYRESWTGITIKSYDTAKGRLNRKIRIRVLFIDPSFAIHKDFNSNFMGVVN